MTFTFIFWKDEREERRGREWAEESRAEGTCRELVNWGIPDLLASVAHTSIWSLWSCCRLESRFQPNPPLHSELLNHNHYTNRICCTPEVFARQLQAGIGIIRNFMLLILISFNDSGYLSVSLTILLVLLRNNFHCRIIIMINKCKTVVLTNFFLGNAFFMVLWFSSLLLFFFSSLLFSSLPLFSFFPSSLLFSSLLFSSLLSFLIKSTCS